MKTGIPEVLIRTVMSLYEGAVTCVRMDSNLLDEIKIEVGI